MIALVPKSPLRSCEGTDGRSSRRSSDAARSPACRRRCHAIPGWSGKGPLKSPILLRSPRGGGLGSLASCCKGGGAFFTASRGHLRYRWHISERGQPLTRQTVNYLVAEAAGRAGLPPVHPHMLRHSCWEHLPPPLRPALN